MPEYPKQESSTHQNHNHNQSQTLPSNTSSAQPQQDSQKFAFPPRSHSFHGAKSRPHANIATVPSPAPESPTSSPSLPTALTISPTRRYFSLNYGHSSSSSASAVLERQGMPQQQQQEQQQSYPTLSNPPTKSQSPQFPPRHSSQVAVPPESWTINRAYKPIGTSARSSSFSHSRLHRPIPSRLHTSISAASITYDPKNNPIRHDNGPATAPLRLPPAISPTPPLGAGDSTTASSSSSSSSTLQRLAATAPNSATHPTAISTTDALDIETQSPQSYSSRFPDPTCESVYYSDSSSDEESLDQPHKPKSTSVEPSNDRSAPFPGILNSLIPRTSSPSSSMPVSTMAGPPVPRELAMSGSPRQASMDSVISALSIKGKPGSAELSASTVASDIDNLVKTAGSPEAVIQYLLKDKASQSQQNAQLWRLVDKQRAMILGLNKDLERALKDKEKYRKKLKEVLSVHDGQNSDVLKESDAASDVTSRPGQIPDSPNLESDTNLKVSQASMAPYPITPPADYKNTPESVDSGVGELLDPQKTMPRAEEYAYGKFDSEKQEVASQLKRRQENDGYDLHINMRIPPSRSLPSPTATGPLVPPPSKPPPAPPSIAMTSNIVPQADQDLAQFPSPPNKKASMPSWARQDLLRHHTVEDEETETDYEDILDVEKQKYVNSSTTADTAGDNRGRRQTREEDDAVRVKIAQILEVDGQSKKSTAESTTPKTVIDTNIDRTPAPPTVIAPSPTSLSQRRDHVPASLNGLMKKTVQAMSSQDQGYNQSQGQTLSTADISAPLRSPGLPASPSPQSAFAAAQNAAASPSPRLPRQPIPMPLGLALKGRTESAPTLTPLSAQSDLSSVAPTPAMIPRRGTESSTERRKIFKGFQVDEFPDLLLPPNALPSISVRVASSRMKPSRASLVSLTQLEEDPVFTLAVVSRSDQGELWRVEKDSMSLLKLDQRLKQFSQFTARTPDRSLFNGHSPAKLDARRVALDQYWEDAVNVHFDVTTALELCKYLSTNTLPPNFDENWDSSVASGQGSKNAPGDGAFRSGYLTKKGKNFGGWKARYFVLSGPTLKYYETPGGAHLGTIKLFNAQIGKQAPQTESQASGANDDFDNQYRHAFLIMEPKKKDSSTFFKHVLCAENDDERDQWVKSLVQWVDYRDLDADKGSKNGDRPATSAGEHTTKSKNNSSSSDAKALKKKHQAKGSSTQHHQTGSETLIGVRYDSLKPASSNNSGREGFRNTLIGLPQNPRDQDPTVKENVPLISAPQKINVMSDVSTFVSRMSHVPVSANGMLSSDEKKQRKRSFFGFGVKTRSSSEGQDSLFDSSATNYNGPIRPIFGAQLGDAVRYNKPVDVNVPLPCVVYRCIQYLDDQGALSEEGIFRLSGSNIVIKALKERFNTEGDINLVTDDTYYDIHAVASLLKLYLRELPTAILTRDLHIEFLSVLEMPVVAEKCAALGDLVKWLPQANATLLKYLIAFLIKIINNSAVNKMTARNVGIVFSPTLNIPAPVFAMFLQHYETIFGIDPEHYELPSPISEEDSSSVNSFHPSFDPIPTRPATASGASASASPHRQRLMDQSRNSPTPPLLQDRHNLRGTPTPPPGGGTPSTGTNFSMPQAWDPSAQQAKGSGSNGYNHNQHVYSNSQASSTHGLGHGYGSGSASSSSEMMLGVPSHEPMSMSSNSRRRESAIYGSFGAIQQQQGGSRLREETRF
ncbi:Rho GTPase activating protein [Ceratocystis pirilliformis]|uniref:Rho GTPase activating protein n=1 Tax=Ceratocystis pirilliformis TaxID=259994 RepID=A0ABR3YH93_9PEZI